MGASSVTGAGAGSVEKYGGGKGPGNLRSTNLSVNGPHVVACGIADVTSNQGVGMIMLPQMLPLPSKYYAAFVASVDNITFSSVGLGEGNAFSDNPGTSAVVLYGMSGSGRVYWMVVRQGISLEGQTNWVPEYGLAASPNVPAPEQS